MSETRKSNQSKTYQNVLLIESCKNLYLKSKFADVHFLFNSGVGGVTRIAAHKMLLAMTSDVFEKMFYGQLKESGDVTVVDASHAAFKEFLQYFYLTEVKLTEENIVDIICLGDKYNVEKCFEDGIQFLVDTLDVENVCAALQLAIFYNHSGLIKSCETFIIVNTAAVFKSTGFLECEKGVLEHILKLNVFSCSEVDVFEACLAWVRIKSKRNTLSKAMVKKHLGQLFYEIRFASMTIQEICSLTAKYDSVLRSDHFSLTSMIALPEFQPENFNKCLRRANWNEDRIIECDRTVDNDLEPYIMPVEWKQAFETNQPLLLGKFSCSKIFFGSTHPLRDLRSSFPVDVEIIEADDLKGSNSKIVLKMKAKLQSKDTDVSLPHPILIRPGFVYRIHIGPFPDDHGFYSKQLKKEVQLEPNLTIKFHRVVDLIPKFNFNKI